MRKCFFLLLALVSIAACAQTNEKVYYYYKGKKIFFPVNYERLVIQLADANMPQGRQQQIATMLQLGDTAVKQSANKRLMTAKMPAGTDVARVKEKIANLRKQGFAGVVHPAFKSGEGKDMAYGDELVVKLKAGTDVNVFNAFVNKYNCSLVKKYAFTDRIYLVSAGPANNYDGLGMANLFFESGLFDYAEPDLTLLDGLMAAPNDPLYNYQWAHQNTGSANQYSGNAGIDMNVQQAWTITRGAGIKVAVIDQGVELTHPDLQANLLQGFDAIAGTANPGDGKPLSPSNGHGTCCAGIIAALAGNNLGIAGVAPESKIIPINIVSSSGIFTSNTGLASAFDYAWQNGADVITNSWGGGSQSQLLDDAIARAVTQGRGGKGCLVLFSSGNANGSISYPSSNANVISVGGVNMCGQRKSPSTCDGEYWWGANFGTGLDLVAPCVKVPATDMAGTAGYNAASGTDGDYFLTFNGTSSAAPNAAGVASLLLAVNPNLTLTQARFILESSCAKLANYGYNISAGQPNGTWNSETGYGMVNAYNAVMIATNGCVKPGVAITAPADSICESATLRLSATKNSSYAYQWYKNGTAISGATDSFYLAGLAGSYTVAVTNAGCDSLSRPFILKQCQLLLNDNISRAACNYRFFDSGGIEGDYGNNESFTKTFNPLDAGFFTQLTIDSFNIASGDSLIIYDGPVAGNRIAALSGISNTRRTYLSTVGALTVSFTSNATGVSKGWFGRIDCIQPVFRTKVTGAFSDPVTWEVKSVSGFINAPRAPSRYDDSIIIRAGNTVTIDKPVELDQVLVETGATLRVNQDILLQSQGASYGMVVNGTLETGNIKIDGNNTTGILMNGTLLAASGGNIAAQLSISGSAAQAITLGGNINVYSFTIFNPNVTVTLQSNVTVDQITMNNAGMLNINGAFILVLRSLNLNSGRVLVAANSLLNMQLSPGGIITGGSAASFVEGPLRRNTVETGIQTLFFPIGKDNIYRPATLKVTPGASGFSSYQAQMFNYLPNYRALPSTLGATSWIRHYKIINTATEAPASAVITLSYGTDDNVNNASLLRIAGEDGINFLDLGGTGTGNGVGTITSTVNVSTFGVFMLATAAATIPDCATVREPANGSTLKEVTTASIGWLPVPSAIGYDFYLWPAGSTPPATPYATTSGYTDCTVYANGLTGGTLYNWYVVPKTATGAAVGCAANPFTFTTGSGTLAPCVTGTVPVDGSVLPTQTTARIKWLPVAGATSYSLYLDTGTTPPKQVYIGLNNSTTAYTVTNLKPGTQYSWYISPGNANGANTLCASTNKLSFTTAAATGGGNLPPVADAGRDISIALPQTSVQVDGRDSYDPDGVIQNYYWFQTEGPVTATIDGILISYGFPTTISGLTAAGKYVFWLQVRDNSGQMAYTQITITVKPSGTLIVPPCIQNISPANGSSLTTQNSATLVWPAVPEATSYDVYLWGTGSSGPVFATDNVTTIGYTTTNLVASKSYNWYVAPRNANGAAAGCSLNATTFTTASPVPACVSNIAPANGNTIGTSAMASLSWSAAATATSYDLYLWTGAAAPSSPTANIAGATTYNATSLTENTTYNWYVVPHNSGGIATDCAANATSFKTAASTPLTCTSNSSPTNAATIGTPTTAVLSWNAAAGASSYDVYIWNGSTASSVPAANVVTTSYTATGLTAATLYNWYVVPRNTNGSATGCISNATSFTTAPAPNLPACVINISPANGSILLSQTSARLNWSASAAATSYDIYLAAGNGLPTLLATNTTALTYYATGLTAGTLYSWYVAPRNDNGVNTACGTTNRTVFTTAMATGGGNILPVSNAGSNTTITLPVSSVTLDGAASYDPDGRIAEFYWYQIQAPVAVTISNPFSMTPAVTGLTTAGNYIIGLQVKDNNGVTAYSQITITVNPVVTTPPGCATNSYPANGTTLSTQNAITLMWGTVNNATLYDVYFWTGATAPSTPTASNITGTSYDATGLTASTQYSWYIVPKNTAGAATGCSANSTTFTIDGPGVVPACVVNTLPKIGSTLLTQTTARLVWPASSSATSYDVYLGAGNAVPTVLLANTSALTYYATNLIPGTLYSWYVAPVNASGANTACGATDKTTFTTAAATGGNNLAPVANAGINAYIILPASSLLLDGSDSYDPDGRIVEYYWYQIQGPSVTISNPFSMTPNITGLTTAGTYIIGLQVKDNNAVTAYAQTTITVDAAATGPVPICVTNTLPAAGAALATQNTATLTWPSSATAISYDVYLAAGAGTPTTMVANTTSLTYSASGLTAGTLYSWYIAPRNASGANTGCGATNTTAFTTAAPLPACITNSLPADGSVLPSQTSARLSWPASAGASSYDVYLAAGNTVPILLVANTTALTYYTTTLTAGTLYSWYIAPKNANGTNTACGTTNRTTFTTATATGGGNIVPVSNAGSNTSIILPVSTVTLDGSASYDPDGRIVEFYWYQIQAPVSVAISNPFSMTPAITGLTTAGNYIIGLQVKDNSGVTAYSQITVTVKAAGTTSSPSMQNAAATAGETITGTTSLPVITGSVSPNPVAPGRDARVQINSNKTGSVVINIVNVNGYIISTRKLTLVRGVNATTIGTISLAQGLYIINIAGGYKPINLKLLVE